MAAATVSQRPMPTEACSSGPTRARHPAALQIVATSWQPMTAATTRPMAPANLAALPRWLRRPTMPQAPTSRPRTSVMTPSPSVPAAEIVPTNGAIAVAKGRRAPTTSRGACPEQEVEAGPGAHETAVTVPGRGRGRRGRAGVDGSDGFPFVGWGRVPPSPTSQRGDERAGVPDVGWGSGTACCRGPGFGSWRLALNGETVPALRAWWPSQL
jgi:hypothetical protein